MSVIKISLQLMDRLLQRFLPDPFVIAVMLTIIVLGAAMVVPADSPTTFWLQTMQVVQFWGDGLWGLAEFTLQMSLILIGGHVVATSHPFQAILRALIRCVKTPSQAVLFCTIAAMTASWLNWGLGLVVGGIVALEVGRALPHVSFRLLVASSYSGFLIWHAGLSGSIPLALNAETGKFVELIGQRVPLKDTIFSTFNLIAVGAICLILPIINLCCLTLVRDEPQHVSVQFDTVERDASHGQPWLNQTFWVVVVLVGLVVLFGYAVVTNPGREWRLDLNSMNLIVFTLGILLHGSVFNFVRAVTAATPKIAPILIQYPLYAGIMGVLISSGLADQISGWFVQWSTQRTLPLYTFWSAGFLNLLIPSGGGQWAVQAPIVVAAARELDVELPRVAMAVAWGDAWTNLAQPFWAVPLLTIAGLGIKDILSFCLIALFVSGLVLSALFLLV